MPAPHAPSHGPVHSRGKFLQALQQAPQPQASAVRRPHSLRTAAALRRLTRNPSSVANVTNIVPLKFPVPGNRIRSMDSISPQYDQYSCKRR
eukprot:356133-Chlamydomonas_euryale.AAC.16